MKSLSQNAQRRGSNIPMLGPDIQPQKYKSHTNRRKAIRERCLDCSASSHSEVRDCAHKDCHLYPYRTGTGKQNAKARDKAIRSYCLWCNVSRSEVVLCPVTTCPLYPFRKSEVDRLHTGTGISNNLPYRSNFQTSIIGSIPND